MVSFTATAVRTATADLRYSQVVEVRGGALLAVEYVSVDPEGFAVLTYREVDGNGSKHEVRGEWWGVVGQEV